MKKTLLALVFATAASVLAAGVGATQALACGNGGGYSYAGIAAPSRAFGIAATVTPVGAFNILAGHVGGWVGVGGLRQGPNGSDEWLQVGFSGFPTMTGNDLYYEVTLPSGRPSYHQIASNQPVGHPARFAVLEMSNRVSWWRVWLNGSPVSPPIYLPGSHHRWAPIATAESWDGGSGGRCNGFLYHFNHVSIAHVPGGGWHPLTGASSISSASTRVRRGGGAQGSFLAAEGDNAMRMLASYTG